MRIGGWEGNMCDNRKQGCGGERSGEHAPRTNITLSKGKEDTREMTCMIRETRRHPHLA